MSARLSPQREAEFAAAVAELDADRTLAAGTWTASPVDEKSVFPPELAHVVEDVLHAPSDATIRASVGVFGDERHAHFTAVARTAVSELLAELDALRAELAHAVPHAREEALKWAARVVEDHVPDEVYGRIWDAAQADQRAANAALDEQQAGAR